MLFKKSKYILIFLIATLWSFQGYAQTNEEPSIELYGNVRFAHLGSDTEAHGLGGDNTSIRTRIGMRYFLDEQHLFNARLATTFSTDLESPRFTVKADGAGLNYGSISFDEFYYSYQNNSTLVKVGRFQKTIAAQTNARRSHLRFQSNVNFIHWSDGIYVKQGISNGWFGEFIGEYQPRNHTTYPYRNNLTFGNNEHNFTGYFGVENNTRDNLNIIQKGAGFLVIPNAYLKPDGYSSYLAFSSRIAFDLPQPDLLQGGSIRIAGELGQNLNTSFEDGTSMVASVGVNRYADKHEFMVEFAKTDDQWLTATVYGPNSDEVELRYRFFASSSLNFDARYRIRTSRIDGASPVYSTFIRATYSF